SSIRKTSMSEGIFSMILAIGRKKKSMKNNPTAVPGIYCSLSNQSGLRYKLLKFECQAKSALRASDQAAGIPKCSHRAPEGRSDETAVMFPISNIPDACGSHGDACSRRRQES